MDKDLLHKIFVSLLGIKQELYAKSFQVNDIRENLPPHVENAVVNLKRDAKDLSRDLQRLEVRGKLGSKPQKNKSVPQRQNHGCLSFTRANWSVHGLGQW